MKPVDAAKLSSQDARSCERSVVAPISAERFTWLVEQQPDFALSLLRLLAHRLRAQTGL